jgi:hypothetical protein
MATTSPFPKNKTGTAKQVADEIGIATFVFCLI